MKMLRLMAGIFLAMGFPSMLAAQGLELSLDECLKVALSKNPTVQVADLEVTRVDYSRKELLGALLPNVDFNGNYSRVIAKQVMYMNMDDFGFGGASAGGADQSTATATAKKKDTGIKMGLDNSWSLGFQGSLPLIAPSLWKSLQVSDVQIARSLESAQKSRQELVKQVKGAYYTLMLATASQQVIQQSYDMAAFTHDTYVKKHALGAASDYDVLRTSVAMKNVEPEMIQSEIAIKQARLQLQILMGVDSVLKIVPKGDLESFEKSMYADVLAIDSDISRNADLKLFNYDTKLLEKNLELNKFAYLPTLALAANYNWTAMNNGSPFKDLRWNPYSNISLALSVPIFSGGQRYHKIKQTEVQLAEMRLQKQNLERSLAMQVDLAKENIVLNVKQIASSSETVGQADRAHKIMKESFAIGASSYLDLRDSELALTRARLGYYQSIYNYLIANSDLELLLGTAPIEEYEKN